jgi:hypothetical protein
MSQQARRTSRPRPSDTQPGSPQSRRAAHSQPKAPTFQQLIDAALARGAINRATHVLLTVLATEAEPTGVVSMSIQEMAQRTGYSSRSASRALNAGIAAGLVKRTSTGAGNKHGVYPATYRLEASATSGSGLTAQLGSARKRPAPPPSGPSVPHPSRGKRSAKAWSKPYVDYLQSPAWRDVIDRFKQFKAYECQFSPDGHGCSGALHLHHLTYERVFHEDLDDLIALCRWHHRQLHQHFDSELRRDPGLELADFSRTWVRGPSTTLKWP